MMIFDIEIFDTEVPADLPKPTMIVCLGVQPILQELDYCLSGWPSLGSDIAIGGHEPFWPEVVLTGAGSDIDRGRK